jgi:hypothetical protein
MPDTPSDPPSDRPSDREQVLARISQVKQDAAERLLADPNVVAVGIGPKIVAGEATGEPAIRVFVRRKLPADQVPPDQLIPAEIDGITTDVAIGGDPVLVAAVDTPGAIGVLDARPAPTRHAHAKLPPDQTGYRPLSGGVQVCPVGSTWIGTLGCLLWDPNNHDIGYGLTNMHVVHPPDLKTVTPNVSKVGQATGDDSSSHCCSDVIGVFAAGGGHTNDRDEAIIRLAPGQKWKATIEGIGMVAGAHPLQLADVTATKYKVAKRGRTTKVTGGTIAALQATTSVADNQILIDPHPNTAAAAGEVVFFDIEGDSGSALVNSANEVVGLVWGRNAAGQGLAFEIGHVLARLKLDGITVEVASTTDPGEVHTVPGAALMALPVEMAAQVAADPQEARVFLGEGDQAPVARPWFADLPPSRPAVEQVVADLSGSAAGRLLLELWQQHRDEVSRLLQRDRRVALAWHRGGGAALTQLLLRLPAHPDRPLPETLDGEPLMAVADRMLALVSPRLSPGLRADLARCRELMPDLAGRTYAGVLAALAEPELVSGV